MADRSPNPLKRAAAAVRDWFRSVFSDHGCPPDDVLCFLPDSKEIERTPLPLRLRLTLYVILLALVTAVVWASLAKIDRYVTATGKLVAGGRTLVVQPLETSLVSSIEVKEGQLVRAGDVLVVLDPTFSQANLADLVERRDSLRQQIRRLEAELNKSEYEIEAGSGASALQLQIFNQRRNEYSSRIAGYDEGIARLDVERQSIDKEIATLKEKQKLFNEIEGRHRKLLEGGDTSRLEMLKAKSERLSIDREMERLNNRRDEVPHDLAKARAERQAFTEQWHSKTVEELVSTQREFASVREGLNKAQKVKDLSVMTAPVDAKVLQIGAVSVGSVAREGDMIMTLVPLDTLLQAEIMVQPRDIGFIREGDPTRIKLDAFPFQRHGTLDGILASISEDVVSTDTQAGQMPVYSARVDLKEIHLRSVPDDFRLIPGMTLTAEIKVGQRRVISYFLYPIIRSLDEGLRDP